MDELLRWLVPPDQPQWAHIMGQSMLRLLLAGILGGAIGVQRELRHKAAGLRTNTFICFGAAMFTVLSATLAGSFGGDHTRIAAQIIPGIGFIGAGSILHDKRGITGITTAATIFVVASIGMAAGGGQALLAIFATAIVLLSLIVLGYFEQRWSLKQVSMRYDLLGTDANSMIGAIHASVREEERSIEDIQLTTEAGQTRILLTVDATMPEHERILQRLRAMPSITGSSALPRPEQE